MLTASQVLRQRNLGSMSCGEMSWLGGSFNRGESGMDFIAVAKYRIILGKRALVSYEVLVKGESHVDETVAVFVVKEDSDARSSLSQRVRAENLVKELKGKYSG